MKTPPLLVVVSLLTTPLLAAPEPDLSFPAPKAGTLPLTLGEQIAQGGFTDRALNFHGPQFGRGFDSPAPPAAGARMIPPAPAAGAKPLSQMPIVVPRSDVDYKLRIVTPRSDIDYKLTIVPVEKPKSAPTK